MNGKNLFNAVGNIDDKYISEFADTSRFKKKPPFFLSPKFYSGIAAVFVIGIAVVIALQINRTPVDIQNNSVHNNDNAALSQTSNAPTPSPTSPYSNKADNTDNAQTNVADTDNAYAEEPYYNNTKNEGEQVRNILFAMKVYAAETPEDMSKNDIVKIKGDFNPLMSSSVGIGIEFEITPYEPVTLQAESGHFMTWNQDSGEITELGSTFSVSETTDFFWTFNGETKDTFIKVANGDSVLAVIKISYDENSNYFYAEMTE